MIPLINAFETEKIKKLLENSALGETVRLPLCNEDGISVAAMKLQWKGILNLPHTGYLIATLLRTRKSVADKKFSRSPVGIEEHGVFLELNQGTLLRAQQNAVLLCAFGGDEAEELLRVLADAENNWEKAASQFDSDGY